jgi:hypothetical protein
MELWERTLEARLAVRRARAGTPRAHSRRYARRAAEIELSTDKEAIERDLDAVDEVLALAESGVGSPPVGGVEDVAELVERAARGEVLELPELRACRATVASPIQLERFVHAQAPTVPTPAEIAERIDLVPRFVPRSKLLLTNAASCPRKRIPCSPTCGVASRRWTGACGRCSKSCSALPSSETLR